MAASVEFHPVANIFPLIEGADLDALAADIRDNGLKDDIWLHEGKIVDGRNRYRACLAAGVEPRFRQWDGKGSLLDFVISLNLHRRHLNESQRAMIAARIANLKHGGNRRAEQAANLPLESVTQKQAAERLNVSERLVRDAKTLIDNSPSEVVSAVDSGKVTVSQAVVKERQKERQGQLETKARQAERARANGDNGKPWEIACDDSLKRLPKIEAGSVRLVFADPPYNIGIDYGNGEAADRLPTDQYLDWCSRWIAECVRVLAGDGSLWLMICSEWADRFGMLLNEAGLHRRAWVIWYETFGVNCSNNFNRCARHLFYYTKSPKEFVFHRSAVMRPSDRQEKYGDKRADPDGKILDDVWMVPRLVGTSQERVPGFPTQVPLEIVRRIVGCCSDPGDLVLDPFCGSASTGAGAIELGRRFMGIEKSVDYVKLARQRLLSLEVPNE